MKVLIIEDEQPVAELLKRFLIKINPDIEVVRILSTVRESIRWFETNPEPDLVFMDVRIADGNSFEIFDRVIIECPVIFTTGHDEYALKAFKVNSIDYLLKPINPSELEKSLQKFLKLRKKRTEPSGASIDGLLKHLQINKPEYKTRFLVKSGQSLASVPVRDIAYFCTQNKLVFLYTGERKRFIIDNTLDEVCEMLDPNVFFRANRQFIVSPGAIAAIHNYFNGRLKLELKPVPVGDNDLIISSKKVPEFKNWLDK
ncbi:MAG: LytTR family DNA-binding domain-containing protein [Bacteroidetes bacterium]|nr:LytTR family DNA-binding domain-containing protein [Bacteroidota bacterium]